MDVLLELTLIPQLVVCVFSALQDLSVQLLVHLLHAVAAQQNSIQLLPLLHAANALLGTNVLQLR